MRNGAAPTQLVDDSPWFRGSTNAKNIAMFINEFDPCAQRHAVCVLAHIRDLATQALRAGDIIGV
jgi:hypothetical protein